VVNASIYHQDITMQKKGINVLRKICVQTFSNLWQSTGMMWRLNIICKRLAFPFASSLPVSNS
jgi:hypothetical protein